MMSGMEKEENKNNNIRQGKMEQVNYQNVILIGQIIPKAIIKNITLRSQQMAQIIILSVVGPA